MKKHDVAKKMSRRMIIRGSGRKPEVMKALDNMTKNEHIEASGTVGHAFVHRMKKK